MTGADGGLVYIVVPSRGPICPESELLALRHEVPSGKLPPKIWIGVGKSHLIVATAADRDDPWHAGRTTIA